MTTYNMYLDVPSFDVGAIDRNQLISALYLPYMRAREHTSASEKKKSVLDFALFDQQNLIKVSPTYSMCTYAKSYHIQIPEAFAGPLGAMPVIKTSPLAVIPIVRGMHVQVSCMYACTRHPDCAHI